jgi:hypothetical protein
MKTRSAAKLAVRLLTVRSQRYNFPMDRGRYPVKKLALTESPSSSAVRELSPAERIGMVWQLTLQAWLFKEGRWDESRLRRDVVRTLRSRS